MNHLTTYNGGLTAEQFLFYEMRIASKMYLDGLTVEEAVSTIKKDNLFQYPTERLISRLTRACYKRLAALGNEKLRHDIAFSTNQIAKQVNLYAIMRYNRIVWEFMVSIIGEKYRSQDFAFSRKDLNTFFSRLQEQHDDVAGWSEATISKIKQVITKILVETEYLDSFKSEKLNSVFLCEELEQGIRENNDFEALAAFNCFR